MHATWWRGRGWASALALALVVVVVVGVGDGLGDTAYEVDYEPSSVAPADPLDGYDAYARGDSLFVGTRTEVCVGGVPPGTAAFTAWSLRWQGIRSAQTLSCRLTAPPPGRGSRDIPPGDDTRYENWSSHATGRGIDLFVGDARAGDRLVDYLLSDHDGSGHVVARRLGVLQIIWDGGCWEAREEQSRLSIRSAAEMRAQYPCPAGAAHRDHVHITLSYDGAAALSTGYGLWGERPPPVLAEDFFVRGERSYRRPGRSR